MFNSILLKNGLHVFNDDSNINIILIDICIITTKHVEVYALVDGYRMY